MKKNIKINWLEVYQKYAAQEQKSIIKWSKSKLKNATYWAEEEIAKNIERNDNFPCSYWQIYLEKLKSEVSDPLKDPQYAFLEDVFFSSTKVSSKILSKKYDVGVATINKRINNITERFEKLFIKDEFGILIPENKTRLIYNRIK